MTDLTTEYLKENSQLFAKLTDEMISLINEKLYDSEEVNVFAKMNFNEQNKKEMEIARELNEKTIG